MAPRLAAVLPRSLAAVVVILLAGLLGTATFTYAAEQRISSAPPAPTATPAPPVVVVPSVAGQAYVFAKGILQDAGFAWRVDGMVRGYAANPVVAQRPLPGTKLVDTGAPLVVLKLAVNRRYKQDGAAEDASSYPGTEVRYADEPALQVTKPKLAPKPKAAAKPKPAPKPKPKPKAKPAPARPPAFLVRGARKEPLDEMPLPNRAGILLRWLAHHPRPTAENVRYWLYQNNWIVTGARFGWWHGARALRVLIVADTRAEKVWGIGARSRALAQRALVEVERRSR